MLTEPCVMFFSPSRADWNLSDDLLLFIEEIHKNNTVAIICSKMQNLKQMFQ